MTLEDLASPVSMDSHFKELTKVTGRKLNHFHVYSLLRGKFHELAELMGSKFNFKSIPDLLYKGLVCMLKEFNANLQLVVRVYYLHRLHQTV